MKSTDSGYLHRRIRVFCCFRYELWNHLMELALARHAAIEVTGSARADEQADWSRLTAMHPDVLLTAVDGSPRDWAFLARLQPLLRWTRLLVMGEPNRWLAARVLRSGASGYLYPETSLALLYKAIETVYRGELWADRRLAALAVGAVEAPRVGGERLTAQEAKVLRTMAAGRRNKEIAVEFGISEATVKSHLNRAYRKLHLSDRLQAALFVERYGLEGWIQRPQPEDFSDPAHTEPHTSADETEERPTPAQKTIDAPHSAHIPDSVPADSLPLLADTRTKS